MDARSVDAWVSLAAFPRRHLAGSKPPSNVTVNHYSTGSLGGAAGRGSVGLGKKLHFAMTCVPSSFEGIYQLRRVEGLERR